MTTDTTTDAQLQQKSTPDFAVYVAAAASSVSAARVAAAIGALKADGFIVTSTWPENVARVGSSNPRGASSTDRRGWAVQCLCEIDAADAVWFLVPESREVTRGAWWEGGYAYSEKKHIVCSGDTRQSVFCALGAEFETDAGALAHLRTLRGLRELTEAPALDLTFKAAFVGETES